ncbi:MAG: DUF362 domain-containing protein [Candidatus Thorarchaeota archaeon]
MKSDVYFFSARTHNHKESMSKVKGPLALKNLGIEERVKNNEKVVIKTHFGALENTRYLRPSYIRFLCDYIKELGGMPFVAESCGWGIPGARGEYGGRANEQEYLEVALKHGYTDETMDAHIIMLDGPDGIDYEIQKIKGKRFNDVLVAGRLREFDYMIMATHFKGHYGAGFGGSIKNLGIGCVSKGGKVQAHNSKKFEINFDACVPDCKKCLKICPSKALTKNNDKELNYDKNKCRYCYMCKSVCENDVIDIGIATPEEFILQIVDNAKGVVDYFGEDKIYYINYAIDITYQCDCCGGTDVPFVNDIGVLSSLDPVALDQACIDLVHLSSVNPYSILREVKNIPREGEYDWFSYLPRFNPETKEVDLNLEGNISKRWELQLKAAKEIGLGNRHYNLIEVIIEK